MSQGLGCQERSVPHVVSNLKGSVLPCACVPFLIRAFTLIPCRLGELGFISRARTRLGLICLLVSFARPSQFCNQIQSSYFVDEMIHT